jgi:hypothetical protein
MPLSPLDYHFPAVRPISMTRGAHTLKFGVELRRDR